jgi:hypothetical protein
MTFDNISLIFPENKSDLRIGLVMLMISAIACVLSIWFPGLSFKLLIAIVGLALVVHFRIHVVILILLMVTVASVLPDEFDQLSNAIFGILILGTFIYLGASILLGHSQLQHSIFVDILAIIYIGFALNGVISSSNNSMLNQYAATEILRCLMYAGILIVSYHYLNDIEIVRKISWVFIIIALGLSVYTYYLTMEVGLKGFIIHGITVMHGVSGKLANAGGNASMITNALPLPLAYIMFGKDARKRKLNIAIFVFIIVIWVLLNSRSNYLFLFVTLCVLGAFHKNRWKYLTALIAMTIIGIIAINTIPILRMALRLQGGMTFREDLWQASFRMISENPILGKGFGYFDRFKFGYMDPGVGRFAMGTMSNATPHNVIILRAVDLGIGAAIIQIICWIIPIIYFIQNEKYLRKFKDYYLYLALGAMLISLEIRCLFDTSGTVVLLILTAMIFRMPHLLKLSEGDLIKSN